MGIRFLCPNGHRLNVKQDLAGERGICPECDARFTIPERSTIPSRKQAAQLEAAEEEVVSVAEPTAEPAAVEPPPKRDTAEQPYPNPPLQAWYIESADGERQGPGTREEMQQWLAEERFTEGGFAWHSGWEDWKPIAEAREQLLNPDPPPEPTAKPTAAPANTVPTDTPVEDIAGGESIVISVEKRPIVVSSGPSKGRRLRRQKEKQATVLLSGLVVVLLVALAVVLSL